MRRLAAILAADVVGYSRMMADDEEGTLRTLGAYRGTVGDLVSEHGGRIFGTAGDSVVAEFASAVQAVRAAVAIQRALWRRNADLPQPRRMELRIGINLGDVVADGEDLLGDGVNVAARLQAVAAPAGICLSGAIREQIEGKLDFPLIALGERSLKNIPRPVVAYEVDWGLEVPTAASVLSGAPALPAKPSIAVLPFTNLSGEAEQEYFVDGITEDIITALSHYRWFFVIARNSTFAYKGRPGVEIRQVARELGVRYVLEGSVRKSGSRVRATAQLIDAESGNHLWAERFDRDLADIFVLQDEIAQSVVAAIEPEMLEFEGRRALRRSDTGNPGAFDCWMRGVWHFQQLSDPAEHRQAETWLRRALQLDPNLSQAHMSLSRVMTHRIWWGWSTDIEADLAEGLAAATRAVSLDDRDPYTHYALSLISKLNRLHEQSLAEAQRAIDINPNFALGYFALGWIRVHVGHFDEAVDSLLRCLRLSPNDAQAPTFLAVLALAHYHLGRYEEALRYAKQGLLRRPLPFALRTFVATLGQLGQLEEAAGTRARLEQFEAADPERFWSATSPYADPAHLAHLTEGLRKAGMKA
jgi:TolB-like protein/class 3 adenylate cyclase